MKPVLKQLARLGLQHIGAEAKQGAVALSGRVECWNDYIRAGYAAAGHGFRGVVNNIEVDGVTVSGPATPRVQGADLHRRQFDVLVIGGGIVGCSIARELRRWQLAVALAEKEEDLAKHTSGRNNGMVHPGLAPPHGSNKARYNVRGNAMYDQIAKELGFEFKRIGSLVLLAKGWHKLLWPWVKRDARRKGIPGATLLSRSQVFDVVPSVWPGQQGAIWLPSTGVVAPYKVTLAYAENAVENGASVFLNTAVGGLDRQGSKWLVHTNRGTICARLVINAAGIWADKVAELAGDSFFTIHPRKGTMAILDRITGQCQSAVLGVARPKGGHTKGGGLVPLLEGNILVGPTAEEVPQREDYTTDHRDLEYMARHHLPLNTRLRPSQVITYFAGTRACTFDEDFVIQPSTGARNLIHVAGIQSPGLASAPAIASDVAVMAVEMLQREMEIRPNPAFNPRRRPRPELARLTLEQRAQLIADNPAYGQIICRCEGVSRGEVEAALNSPVPVHSLDGLKRRVRVGMGRCQGGFCTPQLLDITARQLGIDVTKVCKKEPGSELVLRRTKGEGEGGGECDV